MIDIEFRDGLHLSTKVMGYIQQAYKEAVLGLSAGGNRVLKMPGDGVDGWAVFNGELICLDGGANYEEGVTVVDRYEQEETKDGEPYDAIRIREGVPATKGADFYIYDNDYSRHTGPLLLRQLTLGGVNGQSYGTVQADYPYALEYNAPFGTHIPNYTSSGEFRWACSGAFVQTQFIVRAAGEGADFRPGSIIARLDGWIGAQAILKGRAVFQEQSGDAWKDVALLVNRQGEIGVSGAGIIDPDSYQGASLVAVYDSAMILR